MYTTTLEDFQIEQIARSGQCFRLNPLEKDGFSLIAGADYLEITQTGNQVTFSCEKEEWDGRWKLYFDCDRDYGMIKRSIDPKDSYLTGAAQKGWGIRILKQDVWEMIITFIISQQNNIPRIRKCVEAICKAYGDCRQNPKGESYYLFPTPKALAQASEEELRALNLGYRSKYIAKTARMITDGEIVLETLDTMPYEEAKTELMKLCGVGRKVAECICLFGLHHVEAFPVDTHIQKVLSNWYPDGFPFERYEGYAGILQQYIFYNDLL